MATKEAQAGQAAAIRARAESRRAQGPHASAAGGPESRAERMTVAIETQKADENSSCGGAAPSNPKKAARARGRWFGL